MVAKTKRPAKLTKKQALASENARLKAENEALKRKTTKSGAKNSRGWFSRSWRGIIIFLSVAIAAGLLLIGNILFWAGHTLVDSQSYQQTVAPLVKDPQVQSAIALYTTNQIFENNDVSGAITSVLPPKADFLAPQLTSQLKGLTQTTINKVLASDKFQTAWINVNVKAHDDLLKLANSPAGQDGVINVNEVYQQLVASLSNTRLAFLANKKLPAKVGDITLVKSNKLHTLHVISANINTFKYLCLGLVIAFSTLAIWLSQRRRRLVISIGLLLTILMALSLISFRLLNSIVTSKAQPEYQAGVSSATSIILHPLAIQTWSVLLVALLITLGTWLSGPYRSSKAIRGRVQVLLEGKAHKALFSKENGITKFAGLHKRQLEVSSLTTIVIVMLLVKLSPKAIILYGALMLLVIGLVELIAAPKPKTLSKK